MPKIDIAKFIEQSGVRRTRFGGFVEEDVRAVMQALCNEYEQRLSRADAEARSLRQEKTALEQQCRTLAAQNRTLSGQNATLAGSSESFSRRNHDLDTQLNSLRERNHSLNDQCAVLRLKNADLTRENVALQDRAQQAEAALRIRTGELEAEKTAWAASRKQRLAEAESEANGILAAANRKGDELLAEAREKAVAIDQLAREQARRQAQHVVDAAAAEANEIQNAHQLRLNELSRELQTMQTRREQMIAYLTRWGNELLRNGSSAQEEDPNVVDPAVLPEEPLRLQEKPAPKVELDLSADVLEAAIAALHAQNAVMEPEAEEAPATPEPEKPKPQPEPETPVAQAQPEPEASDDDPYDLWKDVPLYPESRTQPQAETVPAPAPEPEPVRQTGPALTEVPGAIFSSPIVQREVSPLVEDTVPAPGPHKPLLPGLFEEDEEDSLPATMPVQPYVAPAPSPKGAGTLKRRKAVFAVRALHRMTH